MTNFYFRLRQYLGAKKKYQVSVIINIGTGKVLTQVSVEAHCKYQAKVIAKKLLSETITITPIATKSLGKISNFIQETNMPQ